VNFIIVANENFEDLGRTLAHSISLQKSHCASLWTVMHYKNNEATLDGKQAVIFLGENKVASSYISVLPERFRGYGTRCFYEGAKAVLVAEVPDVVSNDDIDDIRRTVERIIADLHQQRATAMGASLGGVVGASGIGFMVGSALWPSRDLFTWLTDLVMRWISAEKRKRAYHGIQHEYVLSRFLKDEFASFVAGVEAIS